MTECRVRVFAGNGEDGITEIDERVRKKALYSVDAETIARHICLRCERIFNIDGVEAVPPLLRCH